jgi:Uma2 family endonuclease
MKAYKLTERSIKEYIQHERETGEKYEYHNGQIYALAGGTINHRLLCGNIYSEIRKGFREQNSNCKPVNSDVKLHVLGKKNNSFMYPDTMVICGDIESSKDDKNSINNPILIVEVLSKSTADYDRGDKFFIYRELASLQEYILIEQDKPVVDIHYKNPKGFLWRILRVEGLDSYIELQSIGISISMKELYFDIDLE